MGTQVMLGQNGIHQGCRMQLGQQGALRIRQHSDISRSGDVQGLLGCTRSPGADILHQHLPQAQSLGKAHCAADRGRRGRSVITI